MSNWTFSLEAKKVEGGQIYSCERNVFPSGLKDKFWIFLFSFKLKFKTIANLLWFGIFLKKFSDDQGKFIEISFGIFPENKKIENGKWKIKDLKS